MTERYDNYVCNYMTTNFWQRIQIRTFPEYLILKGIFTNHDWYTKQTHNRGCDENYLKSNSKIRFSQEVSLDIVQHIKIPKSRHGIIQLSCCSKQLQHFVDISPTNSHVSGLLSSCSSLLYMLRILRSHGISDTSLQDVFRATVLANLTYCSPAWSGYCTRRMLAGLINVLLNEYEWMNEYRLIIRLESRLQPNIGFTVRRVLVVLTRWAITPPNVNCFRWNLKHSE